MDGYIPVNDLIDMVNMNKNILFFLIVLIPILFISLITLMLSRVKADRSPLTKVLFIVSLLMCIFAIVIKINVNTLDSRIEQNIASSLNAKYDVASAKVENNISMRSKLSKNKTIFTIFNYGGSLRFTMDTNNGIFNKVPVKIDTKTGEPFIESSDLELMENYE